MSKTFSNREKTPAHQTAEIEGYLAPLIEAENSPAVQARIDQHFAEIAASWADWSEYTESKGVTFDDNVYPELPPAIHFAKGDESESRFEKLIDNDGALTKEIDDYLNNPLALLLYALVWKSTQRKRLRSIVAGLTKPSLAEYNNDKNVVYFQFGRHLVNRELPIIDQHSARAFRFLTYVKERRQAGMAPHYTKVDQIRDSNDPTKDELIAYIDWVDRVVPKGLDASIRQDAIFFLDKIMYSVGKMLQKT